MDIHYVTNRYAISVPSSIWKNLMTLLRKCYLSYRIIPGVTYVESKGQWMFQWEQFLNCIGPQLGF